MDPGPSPALPGPSRPVGRRAAVAAVLTAAGGAWWWHGPTRDDGSLKRVQSAGELRVGYAVEAPYALLLPDGGVSGESIEVARVVAARLGLRTLWVKTRFERLLPELEARRFDLVAAGLFVNAERATRVRFTRDTLRVRAGWLTRAGNPKGLTSYDELVRQPGVRVAVLAGSVEDAALAALPLGEGRRLSVPDAQSGLAAVLSGAADALALSLPTVRQMAAASQGRLASQAVQGAALRDNRVALALHRKDATLHGAVDAALAGYVGSAAHRAMLERFGFTVDDLPPGEDAR